MKPIRALGLALVIGSASAAMATDPGRATESTSNEIIYDMTVPWPFREVNKDDSDGDRVLDRNDACPGTPRGAIVDANGCPLDTDGDGVPDGIDRCAETPRGAMVDRHGCPQDSDGDGIADGLDRCARTPRGAIVDAHGCPQDSDGDGVADGIDECPGTSTELAVNKKGCPVLIGEVGQQFLDGDAVAFNIAFSSGKAEIQPSSYAFLDSVGVVLNDWPEAKVEIGGHTDSQGAATFNQQLSEKRAQAVKDYLTSKYKRIRPRNLTPVGYGESQPVATNDTPEGRARNRRVEFRLTNASELGKDVETKRYKKRNE
ncbi:MAG: OmpA family protein [Candidatus Krumholzibacteria bacterium]|nr:OmpA family protein [Candidatus Krumholzibacteria bacterium]MDH4336132.1 OmpA family protein [Candidatus Krumholzibacteria bacterium]MDH5268773.1 OmpA family protein [Candidatus Krumholzibacteria bacterium]MDH5627366.1 OmpA family protein [Candidatus Krumholzibacteria bacterium]